VVDPACHPGQDFFDSGRPSHLVQPDRTMIADFPFPVPIVSAIVERQRQGVAEVLVQVRWKPDRDPVYSGTFEIPAGGIELGESIYEALRREVFEETGLRVTGFRPEVRTATHSQNGDDVFAFVPFCCQQQLSGGARVCFVFVCTVEAGEPLPAPSAIRSDVAAGRFVGARARAETTEAVSGGALWVGVPRRVRTSPRNW
jgi:8-oxo-dGTP pyrophosphatase MutT (NUDIX family)